MKLRNKIIGLLLAFCMVSEAYAAYNPNNPNGQATMANSAPVVVSSDQSNLPANIKQVNGSAVSLGQTTMSASIPVNVASDQTNLPANIKQVNGSAISLGQTTSSASLPVTVSSDQSNLPANIKQVNGATLALGSTTGSASLPVVVASDQANLPSNLKAVNGTTISLGQNLGSSSLPVAISAPNTIVAATFTSPHAASAYTTGQTIANSATAGSVTPIPFTNISPANGIPVHVLKGQIFVQTSGNAGEAITNGVFRLHLYGQSPTVGAGDGVAFSTAMVNWCGSMIGTLITQGTDWSVAEITPEYGSSVPCTPGGSSRTIYGLIEARGAWAPATSNSIYQTAITAQ